MDVQPAPLALDLGRAPGPEQPRPAGDAALAARDAVVASPADVQRLIVEVERLRGAVASLRVAASEGSVQTTPAASLGAVDGFSPFSAAYALPAYGVGVVANALAFGSALGSGPAMSMAGQGASSLFTDPAQQLVVLAVSSLGCGETVRILPVVGGLVTGMLLLKGLQEISIATRIGSRRGQIIGALDTAAAFASGIATIPGFQAPCALAALTCIAAAGIASAAGDRPR